MLIESEFTFDAPREALYDGLHDPEILAGALPGTLLEMTAEDRYEGEMEVSIGPVTAARFTVVVELKDKVRPERFDMHVDGKRKAGFVKGIANVVFLPNFISLDLWIEDIGFYSIICEISLDSVILF